MEGSAISSLYVATFSYLPYLTVAVTALGFLHRFARWSLAPSSTTLRLRISPPSSSSAFKSLLNLVLDLLLFRSVYRESPRLWAVSWIMHLCAAFIMFSGVHHKAHLYLLGLMDEAPSLMHEPFRLPIPSLQGFFKLYIPPLIPDAIERPTAILRGAVFVCAPLILLIRRLRDPALRATSSLSVYYLLLLMISGSLMGTAITLDALTPYLPIQGRMLLASMHGIIAQLFIMSIPFTCEIHMLPGGELTRIAYELRGWARR